jgi:hypothetical protein
VEWACGGGARRLQRVAHGRGQIVGMIVHRHENLPPAPKGDIGQRGQALAGLTWPHLAKATRRRPRPFPLPGVETRSGPLN